MLYARLSRACADDSVTAEIVGDHERLWEAPLRLFGGVHYLVLTGGLPAYPDWPVFREVLTERREWLRRWVAEQPVQTN